MLNELIQDQVDFYPTFDFATSPWTLNFVRLPTDITGDFRLSRNVETAEVRRSDGDMCNRLHLSASTTVTDAQGQKTTSVTYADYDNAASQALYGVIEQTANVDTAYVPDPAAWAAEFLDKHAEPAIQISIEGYELQAQTGRAWDAYSRGQRVRAILGALGERITTRVEAITYPDALGQPERVVVELANRLPNFTSALAQMQKVTRAMGGGASRGTGRGYASASEVKQWAMVLTDVEEAVDGTGILQMWQSGIVIDAQQGVTIHSLYQGFESQYSEIQVNRQGISTIVTKTGVDTWGQSYTMASQITQSADKIALVVDGNGIKAASIIVAINGDQSAVSISADKINIDGWLQAHTVTVTGLHATSNISAAGYIWSQDTTSGVICHCITMDNYKCVLKSYTARKCTLTTEHQFLDSAQSIVSGRLVTGYTDTTLHYIGY